MYRPIELVDAYCDKMRLDYRLNIFPLFPEFCARVVVLFLVKSIIL